MVDVKALLSERMSAYVHFLRVLCLLMFTFSECFAGLCSRSPSVVLAYVHVLRVFCLLSSPSVVLAYVHFLRLFCWLMFTFSGCSACLCSLAPSV